MHNLMTWHLPIGTQVYVRTIGGDWAMTMVGRVLEVSPCHSDPRSPQSSGVFTLAVEDAYGQMRMGDGHFVDDPKQLSLTERLALAVLEGDTEAVAPLVDAVLEQLGR